MISSNRFQRGSIRPNRVGPNLSDQQGSLDRQRDEVENQQVKDHRRVGQQRQATLQGHCHGSATDIRANMPATMPHIAAAGPRNNWPKARENSAAKSDTPAAKAADTNPAVPADAYPTGASNSQTAATTPTTIPLWATNPCRPRVCQRAVVQPAIGGGSGLLGIVRVGPMKSRMRSGGLSRVTTIRSDLPRPKSAFSFARCGS